MNFYKLCISFLVFIFSTNLSAAEQNDIVVYSGGESAGGLTQNELTSEMLLAIELKTKKTILDKNTAIMKAEGGINPSVSVDSSAVYVNVEGLKLAIIKVTVDLYQSKVHQIHFFGIKGPQLLRLICISTTKEPVPISYGKCYEEIKKVYGVDVLKGSN